MKVNLYLTSKDYTVRKVSGETRIYEKCESIIVCKESF